MDVTHTPEGYLSKRPLSVSGYGRKQYAKVYGAVICLSDVQ